MISLLFIFGMLATVNGAGQKFCVAGRDCMKCAIAECKQACTVDNGNVKCFCMCPPICNSMKIACAKTEDNQKEECSNTNPRTCIKYYDDSCPEGVQCNEVYVVKPGADMCTLDGSNSHFYVPCTDDSTCEQLMDFTCSKDCVRKCHEFSDREKSCACQCSNKNRPKGKK